MRIGFSKSEMRFPNGLEMAGYSERKEKSTGRLSPLEIASICFEDDHKAIFFCVLDILGFPRGLSFDSAIPIATHTHSGPKPSVVVEMLKEVVKHNNRLSGSALAELTRIEVLSFNSPGVCSLRTERETKRPLEGRLLVFSSTSDRVGLLIFPCHPTVLGPDNTKYSSDLAGSIRNKLEVLFGFPVVFLNSCCGDVSTRFTRKSRDFHEIERLSELFASSIKVLSTTAFEPGELQFQRTCLSLPLKNHSEDLEIPADKYALSGYELSKARSLEDQEASRIAPLALVSIGDIAFLFLPFEVLYSTGETLREIMLSIFEHAEVVCYSLAYLSYLTPRKAYGTYEYYASPYSGAAHDLLVAHVQDLINKRGDPT